jgi:hypothetical protein
MLSTPLQWSNIIAALTFVFGRPPCSAPPAPRNSDKCPVGEASLSLIAASVLAPRVSSATPWVDFKTGRQ